MNYRLRAVLLIMVQVLLVCAVAGKYLYERATQPRVWTRVAQFDPNLPMRGRYLALTPEVDACSLPGARDRSISPVSHEGPNNRYEHFEWRVQTVAENGKLAVKDAGNVVPRAETQMVVLMQHTSCERARLMPGILFFVPDTAHSPFPQKPGEELWAEVTVPPEGPPRAIQLAISDHGKWKVLKFE